MRIGLSFDTTGEEPLERVIEAIAGAEKDGFEAAWLANIFGYDAILLAALAGRSTKRIAIGTAVVPTFPRHPFALAQQALTAQAATGGRFVLGLGPSHRVVIETMLGLSYEKPARHVREYLEIVRGLRDGGSVAFEGETYRVQGALRAPGGGAFPILIGALGPRMLRIAGELADGTITWMCGPKVLGATIVPGINAHAEEAGRPAPRIVAGLPICVTDDAASAREAAGRAFAVYGTLPSYRAMLDAEGVEGPADIVIAGGEKDAKEALSRLAASGVTDFNAAIFPAGPDKEASRRRTYAFLASLGGRIG